MQVQNRLIVTCPFEDYLEMPGISFSDIKNEGEKIEPTKKMILGTHVHNYLFTPEAYNYEDIDIVRPLAIKVKQKLGVLWKYLQPELAVLADFVHEGFCMKYRGRGDLVIPGRIVIDLKVSEQPLHKGIEYFRYNEQTSGYAHGFDTKVALILSINPKTKLVTMYNVSISTKWWEHQIKIRGTAIL